MQVPPVFFCAELDQTAPCPAVPVPNRWEGPKMEAGPAIAEILKREGVEIMIGYPVNHLLEHGAAADIRPVIVRQERVGLHMADAMSRVTRGRKIGVFVMQHGPGAENAYGGVAQAFSESVPMLVMPQGYARRIAHVPPNFNSTVQMAGITKSAEPITAGKEIPNILRRGRCAAG
jgi:acetolactate synthase I/II/III large subunit